MPQRDQILSLQARVEAQARELDDTKSELALARAAHAHKNRETERLRRELEELRHSGEAADFEAAPPSHAPPPHDPSAHDPRGSWVRVMAPAMAGMLVLFSTMLALSARRPCTIMARPAAAAPAVTSLVREGRVTRTVGPEVVAVGEACTVERMPVYAGAFDCRVEVRCGEQVLYGATRDTGYVRCDGREFVRDPEVTARDGDPAMTLDLAHGVVTVEERVGLGTQRVEIALEPAEVPVLEAVPLAVPVLEAAPPLDVPVIEAAPTR